MSKRREEIERQKAQQRRQTLVILAVIAAIAIILIGGAVILNLSQAQKQGVMANSPAVPYAEKNGRAWGPADAPIKVVEFIDHQCPACGQYVNKVEPSVIEAFAKTGKVRYEVRVLAFIGQESADAAKAALCAMDQDQFWQMHATIYANQSPTENLGAFSKTNLEDMAAQLGLDRSTFNQCLSSTKYDAAMSQDEAEANTLEVTQTPTFFVNGKKYTGTLGVDDFKRIFAEVAPDVKLSQ